MSGCACVRAGLQSGSQQGCYGVCVYMRECTCWCVWVGVVVCVCMCVCECVCVCCACVWCACPYKCVRVRVLAKWISTKDAQQCVSCVCVSVSVCGVRVWSACVVCLSCAPATGDGVA